MHKTKENTAKISIPMQKCFSCGISRPKGVKKVAPSSNNYGLIASLEKICCVIVPEGMAGAALARFCCFSLFAEW